MRESASKSALGNHNLQSQVSIHSHRSSTQLEKVVKESKPILDISKKKQAQFTFNQIAYLTRKQYDQRMHQLAQIYHTQMRRLDYYSNQLHILEQMDLDNSVL